MACSTCKNKSKIEFINSEADKVQKKMLWALVAFGIIGLYGAVSLIFKVFTLF